jgi:hypothetical protein
VFLFRPIARLKAPTAAKPDSSREVIKEDKVNRAALSPWRDIWNGSGRQVLCLGLPYSARREGADGSMAPATVFSEALGFRIGGVSLMPLRLVLAYAIILGRVDGNRDDNDSSLSHARLPEVTTRDR